MVYIIVFLLIYIIFIYCSCVVAKEADLRMTKEKIKDSNIFIKKE